VKDVLSLQNMLDILLSWKQESALDYFSQTKTSYGFNPKPYC